MTYPKYYKSAAFQVKIYSESVSIWVSKERVEVFTNDMQGFISIRKYPESNETEFKKAFNKTYKYCKYLIICR